MSEIINKFLNETSNLANNFNWPVENYAQDGEIIQMAVIHNDPLYTRMFWILDPSYEALKGVIVAGIEVTAEQQPHILELCARVNENLVFGCLEFRFDDKLLVVRDSSEIKYGPLEQIVQGLTTRLFNIAKEYSNAIRETLNGTSPEVAVDRAEKPKK